MSTIGRLLFNVFGLPFFMWLARQTAAGIKLTIRRARRKELKQEYEQADTPEERDRVAEKVFDDYFNNRDDR